MTLSSGVSKRRKKEKLKSVSYMPKSLPKQAGSSSQPSKEALCHTNYKIVNGRLKVSQTVHLSTVNTGVPTKPGTPVEEPVECAGWDDLAETNGWDPAYIASFLEAATLPLQSDPELLQKTKESGVCILTLI
jgi:hypothetical protein